MAKRQSVDDKLSEVRRLRDHDPSPEVTTRLRESLGDKSNLVAAAAASIAGDQRLVELADALETAFGRFMNDPEKTDKLCRAKLAVVQALDKLEHEREEVFLQAARHVQFEPVWGGKEDTAAPLRAAALIALTRLGAYGLLPILVDALADPEKEVRMAAAQALGAHASTAASLLLRLKIRLGDREPDVISECFSGLLACDPEENFALVREFLKGGDIPLCEAAMLALGRTKLPQAFEALKTRWENRPPFELRETLLLALAMLRLPVAADYLLDLIATADEPAAIAALMAMKIHAHDPKMRQRIADLVHQRNTPAVRARFEREF
jgi:HEAT repeat protein